MATADEYASWIVANKDKQGTPEFATVAAAYRDAKAQSGVVPAQEQHDITKADGATLKFGPFDTGIKLNDTAYRSLAGAGKAFNDIYEGVTGTGKQGAEEIRKRDAPLMGTTSGLLGNIGGNIAALAPAAFIPGVNSVAGATLVGGLTNALTTPGDLSERGKAGAFGAIGGGVGQSIPAITRTVKAAAQPFTQSGKDAIVGKFVNRVAGESAHDIAKRMALAKSLVAGSEPTAAEVAESGGIAALQRAMSAADPEAYAHRGMQQSAARVNALQGIAGDEQMMQKALKARSDAADPLYAISDKSIVQSDPALQDILSRLPNGTMAQAQDIARMKNQPFQFGKDIPAQQVPSGVLDASGNNIMTTVPAQYSSISGQGLDLIKNAIDDTLDANPTAAIGKNAKSAGVGVKSDLVNWADKNIPSYGAARQAFQEGSIPINQMQVGQELLTKIRPALANHGALARETANSYATALNDVRGNLVKNATGGIKKDLEQIMTPEQIGVLNSVAQDLARKSNAQDLGRGVGSNTFQNFAMDNLGATVGMPAAIKHGVNALTLGLGGPAMQLVSKGTGALGTMAYKSADEVMRQRMAQALLNPQEAAKLMQNAAKPDMLMRVLSTLPAAVQKKIPPEDLVKALQYLPGAAGIGLANSVQQ